MPRLFTGLEIPADVAPDPVAAARRTARGALDRSGKLSPHACASSATSTTRSRMRSPRMLGRVNRAAFDLRLDGLSSFGGRKPRAVVATVAPSPALMELQAEHERLMQRVGLEPEGRKYTPHVTLARLRDSSSRAVADYLAERGFFRSPQFRAERFRAVFLARLGRRRALCGRGCLPARSRRSGASARHLKPSAQGRCVATPCTVTDSAKRHLCRLLARARDQRSARIGIGDLDKPRLRR